MNRITSRILLALLALVCSKPLWSQEKVNITVDAGAIHSPVSPYIYGKNNSLSDDPSKALNQAQWDFLRDLGIMMFRENGGNNSTKYNWRRKLSSHPDWYNNVFPHDWDFAANSLREKLPHTQGMWSFQLIGKAARSSAYNFSSWNYNQAQWWEGVHQNLCGGGVVNPVGSEDALVEGDTSLYLENWNADSTSGILAHWFGPGGIDLDSTKIRYWNMDNEPEIWSGTHDDARPEQPEAEAFIQQYISVAKKARAAFPGIKLVGPVPANEWQWYNWNGNKIPYEGKSYVWLEFFIKRIAEEQEHSGVRLLDVLDIHFYPGETDPEHIVQLHRVYFDRNYDYPGSNGVKRSGSSSWDNSITKEYIFGRCADWLEDYMGPEHGVTFSVTETGIHGDDPNVTASWYASTLGEFSRQGVELFTPWSWKTGMYEVIHLFSNYGYDKYTPATSSLEEFVSAYPMINEQSDSLCIFLVNRHLTEEKEVQIDISDFPIRDGSYDLLQLNNLPSTETFFSRSENALHTSSVEVSENSMSLSLPPLSVSALTINSSEPDSEFGYIVAEAEAEDGVLQGVYVASSTPGYKGTGYVTGFDNDDDRVTVTLDVPESGTYKLAIRYSNSSDKTQDVGINGGFSFPVAFPDQNGFALTDAGNHYFNQGQNTVSVIKNWGWTDIDAVELYPAPIQTFNIASSPVDPDADSGAMALYEMLKMQFGYRIISGQTHSYFQELENIAGKTPMLRVGDFSPYTEGYPYLWSDGGHTLGKDPDGSTEQLMDWYQSSGQKGIISFQWHWHSPSGGDPGANNFYTEYTTFDIRQAVIPGTPEYDLIIRDIDDIAAELARFRDAGIPVLWRPLHEAGGGWFWWGAKGPEPCKALYNIMYDRMKNHHDLHNLIWVWSTPEESWYPGNQMVDIIGHDSYPGYYNYGNQKYAFDKLFQLTKGEKLIAMTENGPIPDPDACLDQGAPWLFFMSWDDLVSEQNSSDHIRAVFSHTDVLTMESENIRTGTEWRSSLYPADWKPGYKDSRGRFLHDFSHAGYHGGGVPIPHMIENIVDVSLPPFSADPTGVADVTTILQQALDQVGAAGGGVVYMPAGTYKIAIQAGKNHALVISNSNTVLRGAGPDSTYLFHDESYMRQKSIIYVAPDWAGWFSSGGQNTNIRIDLIHPTRVIPVESVSGYQVGDQVIVRNTPTEAFIAEHGMTGLWTSSGIKGVAFKRRIDSIDHDLNLLILDAPTRYPLKTRDLARVYKAKPHLQECGVEDFSIGNLENPKSGWGEEDYKLSGTGAYDSHFAQALKFEFVENSWLKNIHTYKPDVNNQDVHLLSNCLLLNMCRHMTIDSCYFQKPQYEGGGGNGYMYTLHANDCLIQNSRAKHSRHNYDFKYPFSNGNVILNCLAENSKYSSDFHMYLSMSNLFDHTILNGDWLESVFRPYGGPIHGHSSTQSVFYNSVGNQYHPTRDYIVESRQYKWGYVIGTSGEANQVKTDPVSGTQGGYSYDSSPRDFVEGVGQGNDLRPVSLYLDQLDRRMKDPTILFTYQVEIRVENQLNGEPVPGTEIAVYSDKVVSNEDGSALFSEVPESFILSISNNKYLPYADRQVVIFSDTLLTIRLEENKYNVTFELLDENSLQPFWGVRITLDEKVEVTDNEGKAYFTTFAGANSFSFQKISYRPEEGSLDVQSDTLIQFLLTRTHGDVKIRLKEGNTPVNNAEVKIGDDSLLSSSLGLAKFLQLPIDQAYHFSVSKEAYVFKEGDFLLTTDTTIDVSMEKISSAVYPNTEESDIRIWPNPTSGILYIELQSQDKMKVQILDLSGAVIMERITGGTEARLNISSLPEGIYTLYITGDRHVFRKLIMKS